LIQKRLHPDSFVAHFRRQICFSSASTTNGRVFYGRCQMGCGRDMLAANPSAPEACMLPKRFTDPLGSKLPALEQNILKYRAMEMLLVMFCAEELKRDVLDRTREGTFSHESLSIAIAVRQYLRCPELRFRWICCFYEYISQRPIDIRCHDSQFVPHFVEELRFDVIAYISHLIIIPQAAELRADKCDLILNVVEQYTVFSAHKLVRNAKALVDHLLFPFQVIVAS
jgi:hypothetical protein